MTFSSKSPYDADENRKRERERERERRETYKMLDRLALLAR